MRELLAPGNSPVVAAIASKDVLLGFDLDGTLAPIADRPEEVRLRARTKDLLRRVAARYPTAVVTGRRRESAVALLAGTGVRWVVGNHGLEWPGAAARPRLLARVRSWKRRLEPLRGLRGVEVEDKGYTLSVHLRHAAEPAVAREQARALASGLSGCRVEPGIEVLNLIPTGAPDKGHAVRRLMRLSGCRYAIYLGDDVTDEAVFRMSGRRVLSVLVGGRADTRARFRLRSQRDVDDLLRLLARARSPAAPTKGLAVKRKRG